MWCSNCKKSIGIDIEKWGLEVVGSGTEAAAVEGAARCVVGGGTEAAAAGAAAAEAAAAEVIDLCDSD